MRSGESLTAGRIAELVDGQLIGKADTILAGVAPLEHASASDLSFLASGRYLPYFQRTSAGAVLLTPEFREVAAGPATRIVVADTHHALAHALAAFYPGPPTAWGIHPTASIGRGARWRSRVSLGPFAVLGKDVRLGQDCVIGPFAVIEDGAVLGDECRIGPHAVVHTTAHLGHRVVLKPGARVGAPGFGFAPSGVGHIHIPHVGGCRLEDDVEVGANTTIDRGSVGDTVVGAGTKIDNLVQVAHNVRIGERCLIMAQAGLAGTTVVEDDVILAGQAGLADHVTVGRGARVAAQAGVIGHIPAGATVSGYPARPHREVLRQAGALRRLTRITSSLERIVEQDE